MKGGTLGFGDRVKDLATLAWRMAGYAVLLPIWLLVAEVFAAKMLPRLAYLTAGRQMANDSPCGRPECDFSQFWPAGVLARAHQFGALYDPAGFWAARKLLLLPTAGRIDWIYPPPMLLPSMLISNLPFEWAFAAWTVGLTVLTILILRWARLSWPVVIIGLLSPASLWNVELGQVGALMGALLLAALLMAARAPKRAGALAGLLILKPQIALLLPAVFLARRWFAGIIAATITVVAVLLLTLVTLHLDVWRAYLTAGTASAASILRAPFALGYQQFGVSVFWMLRSFGAGPGFSDAAQALATATAMAAAYVLWRRDTTDVPSKAAITICLSLLATPYGFTYDMVAYSLALAMMAQSRNWQIDPLDAILFLWPALCPVVVMRTGLLLTPLVVALAALRTAWQARKAAQITP